MGVGRGGGGKRKRKEKTDSKNNNGYNHGDSSDDDHNGGCWHATNCKITSRQQAVTTRDHLPTARLSYGKNRSYRVCTETETKESSIQTQKTFKRTLFINTKRNTRIFGVIPFNKLQNDT